MPEEAIEFDLDSLTLGEGLAAEDASGLDLSRLMSSSAHRLMLVLFVHRLRTSGQPPNWQELGSQRLLDTSIGFSQKRRASR